LEAVLATKPQDARIYLDALAFRQTQNTPLKELSEFAQRFVTALPSSVQLRYACAELLNQAGQISAADQVVAQGASGYPKEPGMLELAAQWAEKKGQTAAALGYYEQLLSKYPESAEYARKIGRLFVSLNKNDDALKAFQSAVKFAPSDDGANRELAAILYKLGKREMAFTSLETYRKVKGKSTDALLAIADLHFVDKDLPAAAKAIDQALQAEPSMRTLAAKVQFLDRTNDEAGATQLVQTWIKNKPKDLAGLLLAANRAARRGEHRENIRFLKSALVIQPNNPHLLNNLASAQASLNMKESLASAELANKLLPDQTAILDTLAHAQMINSKLEAAESSLRKALDTDPKAYPASIRMAELLILLRRNDEAKSYISPLDPIALPREYSDRLLSLRKKLELATVNALTQQS
jgi:Tfp pilus assembly protein PilF